MCMLVCDWMRMPTLATSFKVFRVDSITGELVSPYKSHSYRKNILYVAEFYSMNAPSFASHCGGVQISLESGFFHSYLSYEEAAGFCRTVYNAEVYKIRFDPQTAFINSSGEIASRDMVILDPFC